MVKHVFPIALVALTTLASAEVYQFTDDRDNQTYPVVRMGETSIFARNLNFASKESFCYNNDPANCKKFGRLYTWTDAIDACPMGWNVMDEETIKSLEKDKHAFSQFNLSLGGFKNSKGKFELMDKRMDMWLADGADQNNSIYWFYSSSKNNTDVSTYSKKGAMSVRCINYFDQDNCNYGCECDHGIDYPETKEFENENVLVCTYVFESRTGDMNPTCPRGYNHYAKFWVKTSPATIKECPEPYGDEMQSLEGETLFKDYNEDIHLAIHNKQLCVLDNENNNPEAEYKNCIPLTKAVNKFTPLGKKMLGL